MVFLIIFVDTSYMQKIMYAYITVTKCMQVPAGYKYATILVASNNVTGAMTKFGKLLRKIYSKTLDYRTMDFSLNYLGLVKFMQAFNLDKINVHFFVILGVDIGQIMVLVIIIRLVASTLTMRIFLLLSNKMRISKVSHFDMFRYRVCMISLSVATNHDQGLMDHKREGGM